MSDPFAVDWSNADPETCWLWDEMHNPRPQTALALEVTAAQDAATRTARIVVSGYVFNDFSSMELPDPPPEAGDKIGAALWFDVLQPMCAERVAKIRDRDYAAMSASAVADLLPEVIDLSGEVMGLTLILASFPDVPPLFDFCTEHFGKEGARIASEMLQGDENESTAAGLALQRLAELARVGPAVGERVRRGDLAGLRALDTAEPFLQAFDDYLAIYGWRAQSWGDLDLPTWAEDPREPLGLIAALLDGPSGRIGEAHAEAGRRGAEARRAAFDRLAPDQRETLRSLLAISEGYVAVREDRAMWQLSATGTVRGPALELGRKLGASGALASPEDVVFLSVAELQQVARGGLPEARDLVRDRQAAFRAQEQLRPPPFLGAPPPSDDDPFLGLMFGEPPEQREAEILSGTGASAGVAEGRARIIQRLDQADQLRPGDILVCGTTAAPWTALFAVAAAVVTNTGGALSHSAIVAREFAIPAVVGTGVATVEIRDGDLLRVDGTAGEVTILERAP